MTFYDNLINDITDRIVNEIRNEYDSDKDTDDDNDTDTDTDSVYEFIRDKLDDDEDYLDEYIDSSLNDYLEENVYSLCDCIHILEEFDITFIGALKLMKDEYGYDISDLSNQCCDAQLARFIVNMIIRINVSFKDYF